MPTAPHTPSQHHYIESEQILASLGALGLDGADVTREVLVAICHAIGRHKRTPASPAGVTHPGAPTLKEARHKHALPPRPSAPWVAGRFGRPTDHWRLTWAL